jgi:hypothetical protein
MIPQGFIAQLRQAGSLQSGRLWWVGLYAIAMAYVESAAVVYLRRLYGIHDLVRDFPRFDPTIGAIEFGRELATLVMLLTAGWIAGRSRQSRLGFVFFAFGVWDIFYYIWLKVFIHWPDSFLSPDILFLVPLPWWGPVIAPVLIASLMVIGGILAVLRDDQELSVHFKPVQLVILAMGVLIVLYAFMVDALAILPANPDVLNQVRPTDFNWPIYLVGLALMAWPILMATGPDTLNSTGPG